MIFRSGTIALDASALIWVTAEAMVPFSATVMLAAWAACVSFIPCWMESKSVEVASMSLSPSVSNTFRSSNVVLWSHLGMLMWTMSRCAPESSFATSASTSAETAAGPSGPDAPPSGSVSRITKPSA
ncbi:hypothetical protein D3C73_1252910 [compost metagenome]